MQCHVSRRNLLGLLCITVGLLLLSEAAVADQPAIEGYADYDAYRLQLESIGHSEYAKLESLGRTRGSREVYLLTIGSGKMDDRPALLIVGSVHPPHLLGSELAVRIARHLVEQAKTDQAVRKLLERVTFYVIPRPAPDACEAFFRRPYLERSENERPIDDDRDGATDEDGPDDLDGDGWITMMRVTDPAGSYMPHPDDARVMVKADPQRDQQGRFSLYVEGRDNDADEEQGEDPPGGVAFNRNFTFRYPFYERGAGPHQISEVETRAVADFAFSHPNIAAVLTFTPEDNLMSPWKPGASAEAKPIKTAVPSADAPYFDFVAEQYREVHGGKNPPESPEARGSFSEWAYFHYGRWSFACRGWWIPQDKPEDEKGKAQPADEKASKGESAEDKLSEAVREVSPLPLGEGQGVRGWRNHANGIDGSASAGPHPNPLPEGEGTVASHFSDGLSEEVSPEKKTSDEKPAEEKSAERKSAEKKSAEEKQGAEDVNALRWFARQKIDGFVDWKQIAQPDFPQRKVEVGGFRPFLRLNPPADQLEPLAEKHCQFVRRLTELLPRLAVQQTKVEPLGQHVWRITAVVVNRGYLPTESQMGRTTREPHPLQIQLELPEGASLVTGHPRVELPVLAGHGGKAEQTWLVRVAGAEPAVLRLRVWSPSVGRVTKRIKLAASSETKGETP